MVSAMQPVNKQKKKANNQFHSYSNQTQICLAALMIIFSAQVWAYQIPIFLEKKEGFDAVSCVTATDTRAQLEVFHATCKQHWSTI